jgi:hypothetical protein
MATSFILGATWVYLSADGVRRIAGFALLAFLAMLCKETGVMLGAAIPCLWLAIEAARGDAPPGAARFRQCLRQNARILGAFLAVLILYCALRLASQEGEYLKYAANSITNRNYNNVFLAVESLKFYFRQALFPFTTIGPVHPVQYVVSAWSVTDIAGNLLSLAALSAVVFYALRRQSAAAWVFIAGLAYLLLVLHIIPITIVDNLGQDRFLATPLAFWAMALVLLPYERIFDAPLMRKFAAAMNVFSPRMIAWIVAACWFSVLAWTTHMSIPAWQDSLHLWFWTLQQFPEHPYTRSNYLRSMLATGPEGVEKAVNYLVQKTDVLYVDESIELASILLLRGDKKGLHYLGIVRQQAEHIFDISNQPDAETRRDSFNKQEIKQIYNYYRLSAYAQFRFLKNPAMALQLNEKARWYYQGKGIEDKSEKAQKQLDVTKMVYLYGMGLFGPANALRDKLSAVYGKESIDAGLRTFLKEEYCHAPSPAADGEQGTSDDAEKTEDIPPPPPICSRINEMFP